METTYKSGGLVFGNYWGGGKGAYAIFVKGKVVRSVKEKDALSELKKEIEKII